MIHTKLRNEGVPPAPVLPLLKNAGAGFTAP